MTEFQIDRRKLLKMGVTAGVMSLLPMGCIKVSEKNELLMVVSDSESPVNPEITGQLSDTEFKTISSLCLYINKGWNLTEDLDQYISLLQSDTGLKTGQEPSYYTEYRNAISLIESLNQTMDIDEVWATLLFSEYGDSDLADTKIGRARSFVFAEMIAHFIPISGSFKTFGLWNYRGFFGGPYNSSQSYRRAEVL